MAEEPKQGTCSVCLGASEELLPSKAPDRPAQIRQALQVSQNAATRSCPEWLQVSHSLRSRKQPGSGFQEDPGRWDWGRDPRGGCLGPWGHVVRSRVRVLERQHWGRHWAPGGHSLRSRKRVVRLLPRCCVRMPEVPAGSKRGGGGSAS